MGGWSWCLLAYYCTKSWASCVFCLFCFLWGGVGGGGGGEELHAQLSVHVAEKKSDLGTGQVM